MNIIESNILDAHENIEYHYTFHDLVLHKDAGEVHYAISKAYYFQEEGEFYKQHEMLEDNLEVTS